MENLRTLYLYDEAASMKSGAYPGSQAGVADMFAYDQDQQDWYPAGYWLWNLRGQIAANMSSGQLRQQPADLRHVPQRPAGHRVVDQRADGRQAGSVRAGDDAVQRQRLLQRRQHLVDASCATASSPTYNALNIISGAEIAHGIWQQYQDTGSLSFLQKYYPVMEQAATFLLAYQTVGSDGYLHAVANAHETQWAVQDPTTDIAADQALFPAVISAATLLSTDSSLVVPAAHRRGPDRAVSPGQPVAARPSCSTRSPRRRRRPRAPTPGAAT